MIFPDIILATKETELEGKEILNSKGKSTVGFETENKVYKYGHS